ncbi:MAG: cation diffusion facilitator family transporter [Zymomonas mobilis]
MVSTIKNQNVNPHDGHNYTHDHAHYEHNHGHSHANEINANNSRGFGIGIIINLAFILIEIGYGISSGSLSLIADAGHNLSDVLGLALSLAAFMAEKFKPTSRFTYGYRSSSILAALFNSLFLVIACGAIGWEAIRRFSEPVDVPGGTIMIIAGIGIIINFATALLFRDGHEELNRHAAFLHMLLDALVSAVVVLSGLVIKLTGWHWIDPTLSLAIVVVLLWSSWSLIRRSVAMALNAVPPSIDVSAVVERLDQLPDVVNVHHLHIWPVSTSETAMTAHIVRSKIQNNDEFIGQVGDIMKKEFDIGHVTIQIEHNGCDNEDDC